jgi:ABC-type transport system involved in multi-copper enzyme maturation permease subunit
VNQIWIIARLEIRRAFFSRRALWVYLLALFPAALFLGRAASVHYDRREYAAKPATPAAILDRLPAGTTDKDALAAAGPPIRDRQWRRGEVEHRSLHYFDGYNRVWLQFENGALKTTRRLPLHSFEQDTRIYAGVFQYFYLRLAIFFGCLGIFLNLFRGEMIDKSLHYWFLAPVRRETLVLGKYCAGLIAAAVIFGGGALLSFAALLSYQTSADLETYLRTDALAHGLWYLLAAVLGCAGYGSVFLAAGLVLRNPIIPALVMLLWESINGFLPELLQKLSVLHYLQSLCPVPAPLDPSAPPLARMILSPAAPASAWAALPGLLAVTALVLYLATRAARRLEINYGGE